MKTALLIALVCLVQISQAQTWGEFFKQKKTQRRYLLEQIVALKIYAGYLKKGYEVASEGLSDIKNFTQGEFDLHGTFFQSLRSINTTISGSSKIRDIIKWETEISAASTFVPKQTLSNPEKEYLQSVLAKVRDECNNDLRELLLVISNGRMALRDDARLERLDVIHSRMKDKVEFTTALLNQLKILTMQRRQEETNSEAIRRLYHY